MVIAAFLIGIVYSVPLGLLGQIMLNRSINRGFWHGFSIGIAGAFFNFIYCQIFLIGMGSLVIDPRIKVAIQIFGLLFLLYVGIKEILLPNVFRQSNRNNKELHTTPVEDTRFNVKTLIKTFLLVFTFFISSPTIIAFWINMSRVINNTFIHHKNLMNYTLFSLAFALGILTCQYLSISAFKKVRQILKIKTIAKYASVFVFMATISYFAYVTARDIHSLIGA
jgi:threonine/homoserine/homoserine lactone efflux protein